MTLTKFMARSTWVAFEWEKLLKCHLKGKASKKLANGQNIDYSEKRKWPKGFICPCTGVKYHNIQTCLLVYAADSGERLQDHWSSGLFISVETGHLVTSTQEQSSAIADVKEISCCGINCLLSFDCYSFYIFLLIWVSDTFWGYSIHVSQFEILFLQLQFWSCNVSKTQIRLDFCQLLLTN